MPSFDTVIEPDLVELRNAAEQTSKEIGTRFDFKGTSAALELKDSSAKEREFVLFGDSDFQLQQVRDVLLGRLAKRNVDIRLLDFSGKPEKMGGDKLKQSVPITTGIDAETAKKVQTEIKASKLKLQCQIQGDSVRITGAKRDDLQAAMALLKKQLIDVPLSFDNFRS